ncbi:MAG: hypothetical protein OXC06_15845 [Acidimicrobiaceae bacterium]|nr:hypothetical protein [Acidimicrobiaceae bacterium]
MAAVHPQRASLHANPEYSAGGRTRPQRRGHEMASLEQLTEELLSLAADPDLLAVRELQRDRPTLASLGRERGVTAEAVRMRVVRDASLLRDWLASDRFRLVRWVAGLLRADLGLVALVEGDAVQWWVGRLGASRFEFMRWIAGYVYNGELLLGYDGARADLQSAIDDAVDSRWLVKAEDLTDALAGIVDREALLAFMMGKGAWRDIGDGWLIRWDGQLEVKAERVLQLVGRPMTPAELVKAIGYGAEASIKNHRNPAMVRIDKHFRIALREWGYEKYEGIANQIIKRIERGGGVASRASIIEEFTGSFGVSEASVRTYLGLPIFDVAGDSVRFTRTPVFTPRPPATIAGAIRTRTGWGERLVVTAENLRGYSFKVNAHIAWANGVRPNDSLRVPLNGSPSQQVSVIWRTTNPTGKVEVGRARKWLVERGVGPGAEILLCMTPNGVTVSAADHGVQRLESTAPPAEQAA